MSNLTALLLLVLAPGFAWSQSISVPLEQVKKEATKEEEKKKEQSKVEDKKVEKVIVTGSHIKRIDVEGATNVQTVTSKDIKKTGHTSLGDVLRDSTASQFGASRERAGTSTPGNASIDLRGLGAVNTLVLLNGVRLPTDAETGAVDINMIPTAAIERVEILKDGASAIYGSDAQGGVVNIITKKDFSGSEITMNRSTPQQRGGDREEISLVNGINRGKLNVVTSLQYRKTTELMDRDRPWTQAGRSVNGGPGSYRSVDQNGDLLGQWKADSNCPPDRLQPAPGGGTYCTFKFTDFSTSIPQVQQTGLMTEVNYQASSRVKLMTRLSGTNRIASWSYAPAPETGLRIPGSVADGLGPGGGPLPGATPGEDLVARYRLTELGTRNSRNTTNGYNVVAGSTIQISNAWDVEVVGSHNRIDRSDIGVGGYALKSEVLKAVKEGRYNPFAPEGQKGDLGAIQYSPVTKARSEISSVDVKASGELFDLPAGPVALAVGVQATTQRYEQNADPQSVSTEANPDGNVYGSVAGVGAGGRTQQAIFTEVAVPVTQKVSLSLAGRYDRYSDFGDTINPKGSVSYRPTKAILFRGSAGTGFRAPLMQDLYAGRSFGAQSFIDRKGCAIQRQNPNGPQDRCQVQEYDVINSGNTGLKEERSVSYSAGAVVQPTNDFNIGMDWFLIRTSNTVGFSYEELSQAELKGVNPADYGVIVPRDSNGFISGRIEAPLQNLSKRQISGLDLSTSYRFRKIRFDVNHTQMLYFREEGFPGAGYRNILGESGKPPWRNTIAATLTPTERQTLSVVAISTAGQQNSLRNGGRIPNFTTYDAMYSYQYKPLGTFTLGVRNLFGSTPPVDRTDPNSAMDTSIYDPVVRQYFTGYRATF